MTPDTREMGSSRGESVAWRLHAAFGGMLLTVCVAAALLADDPPAGAKDEAPPAEKSKTEKSAEGQAAPAANPQKGETPAKRPPSLDPLADLIRKSLQPGKRGTAKPPGITMPNVPDGANKKGADRHVSDLRAPYDRRAADWYRKAQAHARAGEWKEALELLQRVTEHPVDSLYRTDAGKWVPLRGEADRLRGEAPPAAIAEYRAQYGGLARTLLAQAQRYDDVAGLGLVAQRYFHTEAGYEAANRLGSLHLDRGEFALAARWFEALLQAKAPIAADRVWRAKAAYVLKQAGYGDAITRLLPAAEGGPQVEIGGARHDATAWVTAAPAPAQLAEPPLVDWLYFMGTPRRTGVAAGGEPLLLPRWRRTLTDSQPARAQLEQLVEDLADQLTAHPTMLFPTMAAGRIAYRTLHGVQVVDAVTGHTLWETGAPPSIERQLAGNVGASDFPADGAFFPAQFMVQFNGGPWNGNMQYSGGAGEFTPLCNLLYRNASFGVISSDGRQLFVVEDASFLTSRQPGNPWQWDGNQPGLPESGSRLISYELDSGRTLWQVGGPANGEPFDPPLAGYFFFGAPVVDAGELYVVGEATAGEKAGQIELLALDPLSGGLRWSQRLAFADVSIEKDIGRRWWSAPVAVDAGVIICPTTVGWFVAVDRVTHSLLWGYRAAQPGQNQRPANLPAEQHEAMSMVQNVQLIGTWVSSPPVIFGGRVVTTPLENQTLVCLDEFTGKELWQKPRQTGLYLAGVFDGRVVVVGREQVTAYDLQNGNSLWNLRIPIPSGRGVPVAGQYHLPLATGEVWSIDLADGKVAGKSYLPSQVSSIGNLGMYRGMLLSLDAQGLVAFEQRAAVQEQIASRRRENLRDAWALIREAEISVLTRDYEAALKSLRDVDRDRLADDLSERFRALLVSVLHAHLRGDLSRAGNDQDVAQLQSLTVTPGERQQLQRLLIDLSLARRDVTAAFEACLALADSEHQQALVPRDDSPGVEVRGRLWSAGRIADILSLVSEPERSSLDARVNRLADEALQSPIAGQAAFVELFATHPAAHRVRLALAEALAAQGQLVAAEYQLQKLLRLPDVKVAARACERLARLMVAFDLPADAARYYTELEQRLGQVELSPGQTGQAVVQALRSSGKLPAAADPFIDWRATGLRTERIGANYTNYVPQELSIGRRGAPSLGRFRYDVDPGSQRLEMAVATTDEPFWSLPLRNHGASPEGAFVAASATGHLLTLVHRGVIHTLSPVDRRVLWTRTLDSRHSQPGFYGRNINPLLALQPSLNLANRQAQLQNSGAGMLSVANDEIICCPGRRSLQVLDAQTGETRWTYTGLRPGTMLFGGRDVLYLRPQDGQNCLALRVADGRILDIKGLNETLSRAALCVGDAFVLPASLPGGGNGLRLHDPVGGRDLWSVGLAKGTLMAPLEADRLALLETDASGGRVRLLNLVTGESTQLGTLTADELKGRMDVFALQDAQNIYLLINRGPNQNFYNEQIPFVRTNGVLVAFDAQSNELRWKQKIAAQNLMLERLEQSPLLVFASRKYEQKNKLHYWSLHLIAVDKLTGAKLLDEKSASQPAFRSVSVSAADRYIELRAYNERIRLTPVEPPAAAGESGD